MTDFFVNIDLDSKRITVKGNGSTIVYTFEAEIPELCDKCSNEKTRVEMSLTRIEARGTIKKRTYFIFCCPMCGNKIETQIWNLKLVKQTKK